MPGPTTRTRRASPRREHPHRKAVDLRALDSKDPVRLALDFCRVRQTSFSSIHRMLRRQPYLHYFQGFQFSDYSTYLALSFHPHTLYFFLPPLPPPSPPLSSLILPPLRLSNPSGSNSISPLDKYINIKIPPSTSAPIQNVPGPKS